MGLFEAHAAREFLTTSWQRAPRFMPGALPDVPVDLNWRALLRDPEVESRLVTTLADGGYALSHGPVDPGALGDDCATPWTVLLQDADQFVPALRALLAHFDFLPRWRLDDVMLSAATDGASVGPHVDQYDVFLVQSSGRRRWQVGARGAARERDDDSGLRLVAPFDAELDVLADPGDVLYLPPGVPHHGVAEGPCVTLSVGFRAPTLGELLGVLLEESAHQARFADPGRDPAANPGRLDDASVTAAATLLRAAVGADDEVVARCLGRLVTEPKEWLRPDEPDAVPARAEVARRMATPGAAIACRAATRLALSLRHGLLFVNGEALGVAAGAVPFADRLAAERRVDGEALRAAAGHDEARELATRLLAVGAVYFRDDH